MNHLEFSPAQLLGPLNEVEQKNAPSRLFVAGDVALLQYPRVAIVGSRKASEAGLRRARRLSKRLCESEVVVVSGLAEGIDTAAHSAAIEQGRTIAVLGTPLDRAYPRRNADLQELLVTEHLVVTQFPVGYPVKPENFPMRNRTMALISNATVIIEAAETSGSLHQGWEALRLGRHLFIAESIVSDPALSWPEKMLGYGARVLNDDSLQELLDELPPCATPGLSHAAPF
jgi:DNA processing protein